MPEVNPEILSWARETAGLTPEEASKKLGFKDARKRTAVERLRAYEGGQDFPSRSVLVNMAKQYRRPLLTFYLSKPPLKGDRGADFRTLPYESSNTESALLDALIRDVTARQSMVRAALEDEDEAETLTFVGSRKMSDGQQPVLASLQSLIDVDIDAYYAQRNASSGFDLLRKAAEDAGVFVLLKGDLGNYRTAIATEIFRGFSIADEVAPFVVINDNDARSAWSFTLLHELTHLLLGQSGVGNAYADNATELFCDSVAGEFLLPKDELNKIELGDAFELDAAIDRIDTFATKRNLSGAMVAYNLYRIDKISQPTYTSLTKHFRQRWLDNRSIHKERGSSGGGNYYATRRHRIGNGLRSLVRRMMDAEALSTTKAATVLGVKPHQVHRLLERA